MILMNCKLEKFWNDISSNGFAKKPFMNCKLEKFWNKDGLESVYSGLKWTVNLKSFEIKTGVIGDEVSLDELKTWKVLKSQFHLQN